VSSPRNNFEFCWAKPASFPNRQQNQSAMIAQSGLACCGTGALLSCEDAEN
jgi:hypothetical protein